MGTVGQVSPPRPPSLELHLIVSWLCRLYLEQDPLP